MDSRHSPGVEILGKCQRGWGGAPLSSSLSFLHFKPSLRRSFSFFFFFSSPIRYFAYHRAQPIGRARMKETLLIGRRQKTRTVLLPPYVAPRELRVFFRVDYATCMRICGVRTPEPHRYVWRDPVGNRQFECINKKKVLVPFSLAAHACKIFNLHPILVDPEPDWTSPPSLSPSSSSSLASHTPSEIRHEPSSSSREREKKKKKRNSPRNAIPVVVLLGHINHGKTTLLDRIAGTLVAPFEAGGITQNITGVTVTLPPSSLSTSSSLGKAGMQSHLYDQGQEEEKEKEKKKKISREDGTDSGRSRRSERHKCREEEKEAQDRKDECETRRRENVEGERSQSEEETKLTFIDTPGHETFYAMRGRASACADIACIVIDVTEGRRVQTEEVLLLADEYDLPILIVINKIDKLLSDSTIHTKSPSFTTSSPTSSFSLLPAPHNGAIPHNDGGEGGAEAKRDETGERGMTKTDLSKESNEGGCMDGRNEEKGAEGEEKKDEEEKNPWGSGEEEEIYHDDIQLVKMELRRQHQKLREKGLLKRDLSHAIMNAVCISALYGYGIETLLRRLRYIATSLRREGALPVRALLPLSSTPGLASLHAKQKRRSDCLVEAEIPPSAVGVILEISKSSDKGWLYTVLVKKGHFYQGSYFVAGSAYGRIRSITTVTSTYSPIPHSNEASHPSSFSSRPSSSFLHSPGSVITCGVSRPLTEGDCCVDDRIFLFPQHRAFRLAEYRRSVENLARMQIHGGPLELSQWEADHPTRRRLLGTSAYRRSGQKEGEEGEEQEKGRSRSDSFLLRREVTKGRRAIEEFGVEKALGSKLKTATVENLYESHEDRKDPIEEEEEDRSPSLHANEEDNESTDRSSRNRGVGGDRGTYSNSLFEDVTVEEFERPMRDVWEKRRRLEEEKEKERQDVDLSDGHEEREKEYLLDERSLLHKGWNRDLSHHGRERGSILSGDVDREQGGPLRMKDFDSIALSPEKGEDHVLRLHTWGSSRSSGGSFLISGVHPLEDSWTSRQLKEREREGGGEEEEQRRQERDTFSEGAERKEGDYEEIRTKGEGAGDIHEETPRRTRGRKRHRRRAEVEETGIEEEDDDPEDAEEEVKEEKKKKIHERERRFSSSASCENLSEPWGGGQYRDREEWYQAVKQKNEEIMDRWRHKAKQRALERREQHRRERAMLVEAERIRRYALREPPLTVEEIKEIMGEEEEYRDENRLSGIDGGETSKKSGRRSSPSFSSLKEPPRDAPVIPIILRTDVVGTFDVVLDELEKLQEEVGMRIPVVHGGVGPVIPRDIVHAEVERTYGYCPVYAFKVPVLPDAVKQALVTSIVIKRFDVFTDLIQDVRERCTNVRRLLDHNFYVRSLKTEPTKSGL